MGSGQIIIEIKLKEYFRTIYKEKFNATDYKKISNALQYISEKYGININRIMNEIKMEEKWFTE